MENASKALLIAAAVLIVILLIAFGMKIFNSTDDVTEESTQVSDHVSLKASLAATDLQFSKYAGERTLDEVLNLINEIYEYNVKYQATNHGMEKPRENTTHVVRGIMLKINNTIAVAGGYTSEEYPNGEPNSTDPTGFINITARHYVKAYAAANPNKKFYVTCTPYLDLETNKSGQNHFYRVYIGIAE